MAYRTQRKPGRFPALEHEFRQWLGLVVLLSSAGLSSVREASSLSPAGPSPLPSEHLLWASATTHSIPFIPHSHLQGDYYHTHFTGEGNQGLERFQDTAFLGDFTGLPPSFHNGRILQVLVAVGGGGDNHLLPPG